jgi:hypothetical protein
LEASVDPPPNTPPLPSDKPLVRKPHPASANTAMTAK